MRKGDIFQVKGVAYPIVYLGKDVECMEAPMFALFENASINDVQLERLHEEEPTDYVHLHSFNLAEAKKIGKANTDCIRQDITFAVEHNEYYDLDLNEFVEKVSWTTWVFNGETADTEWRRVFKKPLGKSVYDGSIYPAPYFFDDLKWRKAHEEVLKRIHSM